MAYRQPQKRQGRNPFIFGEQQTLTGRQNRPFYEKDADGVFPTFNLGGINRTPPVHTLQPNQNTLQAPNFPHPQAGGDRLTTRTNPPNEGGPGNNTLLNMASTAILMPSAVQGLKYGAEKLGLVDTNSEAINKIGLGSDIQGNPQYLPEQFDMAEGGIPHTQLGQDLTSPTGLNLGAPPSMYSDQGAVGQQMINARIPAPQTTATSGLGLTEEALPDAYATTADALTTAVPTDALSNAASVLDLGSDTIGGLSADANTIGNIASDVVGTGTETAVEAASTAAEQAAAAIPFVNVLMAGYKAYNTIDRLASGEDPARVVMSLATLGISDFFW